MAKLLYLHGFGARPGGIKPTFLAAQGFSVVNPALPDDDFAASVAAAQAAYDAERPDAIVGSSRGSAVAMALHAGSTPLVLIAPAWRRWGDATTVPRATIVLHSAHDALIPLDESRALCRASGLADDQLVIVGENHAMNDPAAHAALATAIGRALGLASLFEAQEHAR